MIARFGLFVGAAAIAGAMALGVSIALAARSNDDFKAATRVRALPYEARAIDTLTATKEAGEPQPSCLMGVGKDVSQSVWYRIDVGEDEAGDWDFNTAGSTYDTVMTLYRAPSRGKVTFGDLDAVECNDDNFLGTSTTQARFFADLAPGRYYVQIGDYDTPGGAPHMTEFSIRRITGLIPIGLPLP